ncbi:hypothetical protein MRB53_023240 [Persea americana]|uniref:Uncharacterized protein n=1 Tax=Persea americana TaxID=3435 RepID=A0ACC2L984_PERAE|nr:hypothetical protein MRB53_023240 [Persea americana]
MVNTCVAIGDWWDTAMLFGRKQRVLVRAVGRRLVIYSTCSIDPEENEERVAAFHNEFRIDTVARYVPSSFVTEEGFFFSNPVKHSLDGTFAACLVRSLTTS